MYSNNGNDYFKGPSNKRQLQVVRAFQHAWNGYRKYAWGRDELKPISKGWINWMGVGLTIVDSLDTMLIMGLKDEFLEAREWVAMNLTFARSHNVQTFEIVIRVLGGLLSAFHLSNDTVFLTKAIQLGMALEPCFKRRSIRIPCNNVNLLAGNPNFGEICIAEAGTIQLELRDLGRASRIKFFETAALEMSTYIHEMKKHDGLVETIITDTGRFKSSAAISVGGSGDSYYEYLLKQWIQTGKTIDWLKEDYLMAVDGIRKHLLRYTTKSGLAFVGSYSTWASKSFNAEMDHLTCFLPGTLALGVLHGLDKTHLEIAANLTATCYEMYRQTATGLSPDVVEFGATPSDQRNIYFTKSSRNLQRPETVESLYYMYLATQDPKYKMWGWKIFQSFEMYSKVTAGYANVGDVNDKETTPHLDKMESFFLAETLKYLYLLFEDRPSILPFDRFVFNTEAHPLPIYDS